MRNARHKGGPGRRSHRRPLEHGDLSLLILSLIQDTPRHGYDLITQIETRTAGAYKPSPGVMYPALEVLQDMGHVEIVPNGTKKVYHITAEGLAKLTEAEDDLARIYDKLDRLAAPSVRAAVHRLHDAVKSHMRENDVSETERAAIVKILDEAYQKIGALKAKDDDS
ncbi:PadR family transcriptional regulator [Loktanella agnita]|uniref:PadR family transcriptional regulator n=1 Tax=Loktanella agnita TaxID=287097 RepID=UPI0039896BF1